METLSIGQVARRAGVGVETVRFYEREGVLGMGGIGKSALVVRAMQRLADHFDVLVFRSLPDADQPRETRRPARPGGQPESGALAAPLRAGCRSLRAAPGRA